MPLQTTSWDEPKHLTDVVKSEPVGTYSRDTVTIANGQGVLEIGTVLGVLSSNGQRVAHVNGASDGSQVAAEVLVGKVDATSSAQQAVVIARLAEVSRLGLVWDSSVDNETKKDAAIAQLKTAGIIVRDGA